MRIQRGLLQTISETIPYSRIQAVRQVEPLLWRPFGWCRLEVDIAGATRRNQRSEGTAVVRKALLPVGSQTGQLALDRTIARGTRPRAHATAATGPSQGPPQLPLPFGRPRRHPCGLRDRAHQPGHDLGPPREVPEHPPGAGTPAARRSGWPRCTWTWPAGAPAPSSGTAPRRRRTSWSRSSPS